MGAGQVYRKTVTVELEAGNQFVEHEIMRLIYSPDSHRVYGSFVEAFATAFDSPATLQVDEQLHNRLVERFGSVEYGLTFVDDASAVGTDDLDGVVSRADFNRVGVGDRARMLALDHLDPDLSSEVVGVTHRDVPVAERSVHTYSLDERSTA